LGNYLQDDTSINGYVMRRYWAIIGNLAGTVLYSSQTCNSCHPLLSGS